MIRIVPVAFAILAFGCGKPPSTEQPEPVRLERKFFEPSNDPSKSRTVPNAQPK
jgi:hypothetical protein